MTNLLGHWASTWILAVVRAGVMEPFGQSNTFSPDDRAARRFRADSQPPARRLAAGRPGAAKIPGNRAAEVSRSGAAAPRYVAAPRPWPLE